MDILPSVSIFRELQDIHDTGYFSAQLSLDDHWQQSEYELNTEASLLSPETPSSVPSRTSTPAFRKTVKRSKSDLMVEKAYEVLSRGDNEFKTIGANVAWKLERMEEDQRNIAEHFINTILLYGITKKLNDDTTINLQPSKHYSGGIARNMSDYNNSIHSNVYTHPQTHISQTQLPMYPTTQSQMRTYAPLQSPNEIQTHPNYQAKQLENQTNSIAGESTFNIISEYILLNEKKN